MLIVKICNSEKYKPVSDFRQAWQSQASQAWCSQLWDEFSPNWVWQKTHALCCSLSRTWKYSKIKFVPNFRIHLGGKHPSMLSIFSLAASALRFFSDWRFTVSSMPYIWGLVTLVVTQSHTIRCARGSPGWSCGDEFPSNSKTGYVAALAAPYFYHFIKLSGFRI